MRRTKIVCTLGPSSSSPEIIRNLFKAGMDIARLNFSHSTHSKHGELLNRLRTISQDMNKPVAILQDLQGPKIRVGDFASQGILLKKGQTVTVTTRDVYGNDQTIPISYKNLHEDVKAGDHLLLDDGLLDLVAKKVEGQNIECEVVVGGLLSSQKGVNLPGVSVNVSSLSEKDRADLKFGLELGVDFVALSFVRTADDITELKDEIKSLGKSTPVIAKIEKPEAVDHISEIIDLADGAMVARGDLGVEIGPERVPIIQKDIINRCRHAGKPVITATQMLESMRNNPRPTRAEASDVANAIFDQSDAVMLSGETSSGNYPVESVRMMDRIIRWSEKHSLDKDTFFPMRKKYGDSFADAISESAFYSAYKLKAKAIVAFTQTGFTARNIAKRRPATIIFAMTPDDTVQRQLLLSWGVFPLRLPVINTIDEMIEKVDHQLCDIKHVHPGDIVLILAGAPIGEQGTTNMLTLHRIEDHSSG